MMITNGEAIEQCAALCWRLDRTGKIEVLLLTSRRSGRWVIPKGNIEKGEQLHECARREAMEEAGVIGRVGKRTLGYYTYLKDGAFPVIVSVFPMLVSRQSKEFQEKAFRQYRWVLAAEAPILVTEPELKGLFRMITSEGRPNYFTKATRNFSTPPTVGR